MIIIIIENTWSAEIRLFVKYDKEYTFFTLFIKSKRYISSYILTLNCTYNINNVLILLFNSILYMDALLAFSIPYNLLCIYWIHICDWINMFLVCRSIIDDDAINMSRRDLSTTCNNYDNASKFIRN